MKWKCLIGLIWLLIACSSVSPGQATVSLNVHITQPVAEPEATILKKLRISPPLNLELSGLTKRIEPVIRYFENSGYPFVQVNLDTIKHTDSGISATLVIRPGERIIMDTIMNRTGFRISAAVLSRLINIRPGELYRESAVTEAGSRLARIPYINQVRRPEVGFHPGKASLYVYPEKAAANRFDGWVGLSPDLRSAGKLAFSGAVSLNLNNVLAQGETWLLDWRRNQDASQKLSAGIRIPFLAGLPVGLTGNFDLYRQDTSYLNLGWDLGIPYQFSPGNSLNVFVRHRESSIINPGSDILSKNRQPFSSLLSGLAWEINQLDNPVNPYRGYQIQIEASTGRKSIPDSISMPQSELSANIAWFQPLLKNLTCMLRLSSGYRKSAEVYDNEQYRLGGLNLLRGFDEDVFHTDAFEVTSLEIRYILDQSSYLVFLTDLGFLRINEGTGNVLKMPAGMGLGGQIRTAGGVFRIIFAIGKEPGQAVNLKNSKIHLGYVGVF